jgi:DNA modification methylase
VSPYYADESVTLYHGDCREITEWLAADVLVTDPPYGVGYRGVSADYDGIANDHDFTAAATAIRAWSGPLAVFANHASLPDTLSAVAAVHQRVRVATWHKTNVNGATPGNPWLADVEFVVCGVPEWPKTPASAVMAARRHTGNPDWNTRPDAYLHPTQKPTSLMEQLILAMPSGVIADPFAGSGSTLVAARNLGRKAVGVEIEERHCETVARRLNQGAIDFGGVA